MNQQDEYDYSAAFADIMRLLPRGETILRIECDTGARFQDRMFTVAQGMVTWTVETLRVEAAGKILNRYELTVTGCDGVRELALIGMERQL